VATVEEVIPVQKPSFQRKEGKKPQGVEVTGAVKLEGREEVKEEIDPVYIQESKEEPADHRSAELGSNMAVPAGIYQDRASNATPRSMARSHGDR